MLQMSEMVSVGLVAVCMWMAILSVAKTEVVCPPDFHQYRCTCRGYTSRADEEPQTLSIKCRGSFDPPGYMPDFSLLKGLPIFAISFIVYSLYSKITVH